MATKHAANSKRAPRKKSKPQGNGGGGKPSARRANKTKSGPGSGKASAPTGRKPRAPKPTAKPSLLEEVFTAFDTAHPVLKGAVFLGTASIAVGAFKHNEAKQAVLEAKAADDRAATQEVFARVAWEHARVKDAEANFHQQRAAVAETRANKLVKEFADVAHTKIARLRREDAPPLLFDGCLVAQSDGSCIRVNVAWVLSGIVDTAAQKGEIWGRVFGVVAHEWYHHLDTARGQRGLHHEELAADDYAGQTLADLGESPEHFETLLRTFPESRTHPAGALRADRMLAGYRKRKRALEPPE